MTYPTSPAPMPTQAPWPVDSYPGDRAVRADIPAAVLLIVGGAAGIVQFWLPWRGASGGNGTGSDAFEALKAALRVHGSFTQTVGAYAILAVVVLGVALLLLGVLMLLPLDHRPPGVVAVVAAALAVLCAVWWVFWHSGSGDISSAFSTGWFGWYLFLASGVVGLAGAIKALVSST